MGFLDTLLGRTKPVKPNLDVLFRVPSAAVALQAGAGLVPTGTGGVCFRAAEGELAEQARTDALALLNAGQGSDALVTRDEYSYTWIVCRRADGDLAALVTDLHAVNVTFAEAGFGPSLLCTTVGFRMPEAHRTLGLVYLFKRGTLYPFAPMANEHRRDNALELQARAILEQELPIETDLARWFPIWGAPAL